MARRTDFFFFPIRKSQLDWLKRPICTTVPKHSTAPVPAFCSSGCLLFWLAHEVPTTQVSYFTPHQNQNSKNDSRSMHLQSQQDESRLVLLHSPPFSAALLLEDPHSRAHSNNNGLGHMRTYTRCNNKVSQEPLVQEEVSQGGHSMVESNSSTAVWDMNQPTLPTCHI